MQTLKIEANYRTDMSKSHIKELRKNGFVTASIFGHDSEPVPIEVNIAELAAQIKHAEAGTKSLIDIKIKGAPKKADGTVIIKEFYKDPLTRKVLDLQFQRVNLKEKIHVGVPIVLTGDAAGVKEGGILEQLLDELQVNCLPGEIPPHIDVDVSGVGIGEHVRVTDITVPSSIEILSDPDTMVATCVAPHVHHEAAPEAAAEGTPQAEES